MTFCPDIKPYEPTLIDRIKFWRRRIPQLLRFHFHYRTTYQIKKLLWKRGLIYKDSQLIMELPGMGPGVWMRKDALKNMVSIDDIICSNSYTEKITSRIHKQKEQDNE